jgi:hypothetical protein
MKMREIRESTVSHPTYDRFENDLDLNLKVECDRMLLHVGGLITNWLFKIKNDM